jgi:hypothetical protein
MSHQIKVSADTTEFKRNLLALSKEIGKLGKKDKISFLDKDSRQFMERGAKEALSKVNSEYIKIRNTNSEILQKLKGQKLEQRELTRLSDEYVKNQRKLTKISSARTELQNMSPSAAARFGRGFGAFSSRIPGVGMARSLGGMGGMAMLGGAAGMAGGALAALAIGRGYAGYQEFNQNADTRIGLMGRGHSPASMYKTSSQGTKMGFSASQIRDIQMQSTDIFGTSRSGFDQTLGTAKIARGMGVDSSQILGVGAGVRGAVGSKAAFEIQGKVNAKLIATELDGVVGPWLETMTNLLGKINEDGLGLDDAAIGILGAFANAKSGTSPEMVAKMFGGLDASVRGATGDKAAFFMSAFNQAGIGKGLLGGSKLAMMQGLFGGDAKKLRDRGHMDPAMINDFVEQGILTENGTAGFQKKASAITDRFGKLTQKQGSVGKAFTAEALLGTGNPVVAAEMMGLLSKAAKEGKLSGSDEKRLKELQQTPQERLENIMKDQSGALRASQSRAADGRDMTGKSMADIAIIGNDLLASIDKNILFISDIFRNSIDFWKQAFSSSNLPGVPREFQSDRELIAFMNSNRNPLRNTKQHGKTKD